jgi:galactokinase
MSARSWRAPGRVNLIGEHTDYNLGYVLPMAIDLACTVTASPSDDGLWHVHSENRGEERSFQIGNSRAGHWSDYAAGVEAQLLAAGFALDPRQLRISSTIPEGGGLSSSAALEVSCALAMLDGQPIEPLRLAQLCQKAEVEFVGLPCGIMDQYIAIFAQAGTALRIDCRSQTHEAVALPGDVEILAVNSMVKHELADSAYKDRTVECAAAVAAIKAKHPSVESLRDVTIDQLTHLLRWIPPLPARRARHVIEENERVLEFAHACRAADLPRMGELFVDSHRSLQYRYEVSCPELDFLVDTAMEISGVYGARMTGGGFGGCTVNLVSPGYVDDFRGQIEEAYTKRFGMTPQIYRCIPSGGAGEVVN